MKTRRFYLGGAALLAAGGVWAGGPGLPTEPQPPNPWRPFRPAARPNPFLEICAPLRNTGAQDFPAVFQRAAQLFHRPAEMFNVLICWVQCGGSAQLAHRSDLGQHFLFAGALEANFDRGREVTILKEITDGTRDLNDLAAGLAGGEWVRRAYRDQQWMTQWATGQKTLTNNLPQFQYGAGPNTNTVLQRIMDDIAAAYAR